MFRSHDLASAILQNAHFVWSRCTELCRSVLGVDPMIPFANMMMLREYEVVRSSPRSSIPVDGSMYDTFASCEEVVEVRGILPS